MTRRAATFACLVAALAAGAASNAAQGDPGKATEVRSIEPGLYEVTITALSVDEPGESPDPDLQRRARIGEAQVSRQCSSGRPPRVGDPTGGICVFTRIGDREGVTDRAARCTGTEPGHSAQMTITGTRAGDRYDYRIRLTERDAQGREVIDVLVREEGRRLGACPARPG